MRSIESSTNDGSFAVVDLFAGAGLLSYAFSREGFRVSLAVENDPRAVATYQLNFRDNIVCSDVADAIPIVKCDVLVGGSPCQGFSTLGKTGTDDSRNALPMQFVRWARVLNPKLVVIENVEPFLCAPVWKQLEVGFKQLGYDVFAEVLNALDYGAAQRRKRSFTIASRVGSVQIQPLSEYADRTVRDAWSGLPAHTDNRNWHYSPEPSELARQRMRRIPRGGGKGDLMRNAPELCPPSWWRVKGELTDVWGRLKWDEPSNTLRTCLNNPSKGRYIHPDQDRVISLREAARLHSIPDEFQFVGYPIDIARQIGNSVPPALGHAVARGVRNTLCN